MAAMTYHLDTDIDVRMLEIQQAEAALSDLLEKAERMHRANIEHDPISCLLCFETR